MDPIERPGASRETEAEVLLQQKLDIAITIPAYRRLRKFIRQKRKELDADDTPDSRNEREKIKGTKVAYSNMLRFLKTFNLAR